MKAFSTPTRLKKSPFGSKTSKPKPTSSDAFEDDDDRPPIISSVSKTRRKQPAGGVFEQLEVAVIKAKPPTRLPAVIEDGAPVEDPSQKKSPQALLGIKDFEIGPLTPETLLEEEGEEDGEEGSVLRANANKNDSKIAKPSVLKQDVSSARVRGLVTLFGQRADKILSLLEDEQQTDGALTLIQRTLLQTMVDVLPVVERGVRRSRAKRGVYQLNQVVSQIRELMQDMQALKDKGQLGVSVSDRVIRPAYQDLAVQISLAFTEIENSAQSRMTSQSHRDYVSEVLLPIKRNLATYLMQQYGSVRDGVVSSLS